MTLREYLLARYGICRGCGGPRFPLTTRIDCGPDGMQGGSIRLACGKGCVQG